MPPRGPAIRRECTHVKGRHVHGTKAAYQHDRCRCDECCAASSRQRHIDVRKRAHRKWAGVPVLVDATPTRRRLQALAVEGWSIAQCATAAGVSDSFVLDVREATTSHVTPANAAAVVAAFERLGATLAPRTWMAFRTSRCAVRRGWVPALAWDDIDTDPTPYDVTLDTKEDDEAALVRAMAGDRTVKLTRNERVEAVRRLAELGLSDALIGQRLGRSADAVAQDRRRHGIRSRWQVAA